MIKNGRARPPAARNSEAPAVGGQGIARDEGTGQAFLTSNPSRNRRPRHARPQTRRCPFCDRAQIVIWGPFGDSRARCLLCGLVGTRSTFAAVARCARAWG